MNRLVLPILYLAMSVTMIACDPAFVRSIDVAIPHSASAAAFPLSDVDALAASLGFVRTEPPNEGWEMRESEGYELIAYYDRSEADTSNIEWLTISAAPDDRNYRLDMFAFVALGEPSGLGEFREQLTALLCQRGYIVDSAEDCGG